MDNELFEKIIVSYGVLALHSLQNSANKDLRLEDLKKEHFANEIKMMISVYPKEVAVVKYSNLK